MTDPDKATMLRRVCEQARVSVVAACAGGEFGAHYVRDEMGHEWVLKISTTPAISNRIDLARSTTDDLRRAGYPAPAYGSTGKVDGALWYLQQRLPGSVPKVITPDHIDQLVGLAHQHADRARRDGPWPRPFSVETAEAIGALRSLTDTDLIARLDRAADRVRGVELRTGDIAHGDFHHLNCLTENGTVTGVFDWDFVVVGDWRVDLVVLAFWTRAFRHIYPDPEPITMSSQRAEAAMREACPDDVLAHLTLWLVCRELAFSMSRHTVDHVEWLARRIYDVSDWWS